MAGSNSRADVDLLLLDEEQNATFDDEYHSPADLADKVENLKALFPSGPRSFLDLGGGNGHFLDYLLEAFPAASGTLIDISSLLLGKNAPHPRKRLVEGSVADLEQLVGSDKFDVISVNWVLHHLVGSTYETCMRNMATLLSSCVKVLAPGGVIVVAENMFDGPLNASSHIIYGITRIEHPQFVRLARRYFNTSGVGVCFQSEAAWRSLFADLRLRVVREQFGRPWPVTPVQRLMTWLLLLKDRRKGHFYLRPD